LTLHFRVSERVATPTSVVLMAVNAFLGACLHAFVLRDFGSQASLYWLSAVPVVVVFAPLGAILMSRRSRHFVSRFLYTAIVVQFVGALIVLRPPLQALLAAGAVTVGGVLGFWGMTRWRRTAVEGSAERFLDLAAADE
jgi:hypothetical protein